MTRDQIIAILESAIASHEAGIASARAAIELLAAADPDSGSLLDANQVAKHLGLHINTVWRMLADGTLQGFKIRGVWRVPPSALAAYLERNAP